MSTVLFFIAIQVLSLLAFGGAALASVAQRKLALQQEIASGAAERAPIEGYLRYAAARFRTLLAQRRTNTTILLLGFIIAIVLSFSFINSDISNSFSLFASLLPYFFAVLIGLYSGSALLDLVGSVEADAEALRYFKVTTLQRSDILKLKLRSFFLVRLPIILYFELLSITLLAVTRLYFLPLLLISLAALATVVRTVFARHFYALTAAVRPIDQTEWAHLAPRIRMWGQRAGIEFASILIQQDFVGMTNSRVMGLGRPTLVISETFLRNSEWRQWDGLVALAIGAIRQHLAQIIFIRTMAILGVGLAIIAAIPFIVSQTRDISSIFSLIFVAYFLFIAIRVGIQKYLRTRYFQADVDAVALTGDPTALMVTLNTIAALNGVPLTQRGTNMASTQDRIARLDQLARQPGPRAPYASQPVPAIVPLQVGSYWLTVPLEQAATMDVAPAEHVTY